MPSVRQIRFVYKPVVFALCLLPFAWICARAFELGSFSLGPNPIEDIQDEMGIWGLRLIMLTLAVTPARHALGKPWPLQFRRMLGLFAFFYILMHFLTWLFLDQGLLLSAIAEDIVKRPFITIGFAAFLILIALTATSTSGARRRLGRRWQQLHNWVYIAAILGVWHYWWQVKLDASDPAIYAAILSALLGYRLWRRRRQSRGRTAA